MKINNKVDFFLHDVYNYDIPSCHYNIIKKLNYKTKEISDPENKEDRNIKIGMMMRDNTKLSSILRNITESVIDEYIKINRVNEDEIVIRQYDGIITTRKLQNLTSNYNVPLILKRIFQFMIIGIDRDRYLGYDGKQIFIKGVPNKYKGIILFLQYFSKINFLHKESVFKGLQKIKDSLLKSEDPSLFAIPTGKDTYNVILKKYGQIEIKKGTVNILDTSDIDKEWYFEYYIQPFTKSITFEFLLKRNKL